MMTVKSLMIATKSPGLEAKMAASGSSSATLLFTARNRTPHVATLFWCDGEREVAYCDALAPGASRTQETFHGHTWRLRSESGMQELCVTGASGEELALVMEGYVAPPDETTFYAQSVEVGCAGLRVRASEAVASGALLAAADIAREMVRHSPSTVTERLAKHSCSISVIGRHQVVSDIPEQRAWALAAARPPPEPPSSLAAAADEAARSDSGVSPQRGEMARALRLRLDQCDRAHLVDLLCLLVERGSLSDVAVTDALVADALEQTANAKEGGAPAETMEVEPTATAAKVEAPAEAPAATSASDEVAPESTRRELSEIDRTTRGVGGGRVTSCGEENLLDIESDPHYREESVLIHEFGHTVMNLGMSDEARELVRSAHSDALRRGLYPRDCYMGSNEDEYWAEGTQAWFDASVRTDVNASVNSRARLCAHDPALALMLRHAYGDGAWRFTDSVPTGTRERWRARQTSPPSAGSAGATRRPNGGASSHERALPVPGGDVAEYVPPTSEEEEERHLAMAIAQSLEVE